MATAPTPECGPDEHLEMGYPYCCGICVPNEQCLLDATTNAGADCPAIDACPAGQHIEIGAACCPTCVADPVGCYSTQDCASGQTCSTERGDCQLPPGCADGSSVCIAVCYGECL